MTQPTNNATEQAPEFISCDDAQYEPYLRNIGYDEAESLFDQGALVYGEMPSGDEVMRIHKRDTLNVCASDGFYVLSWPMRIARAEHHPAPMPLPDEPSKDRQRGRAV